MPGFRLLLTLGALLLTATPGVTQEKKDPVAGEASGNSLDVQSFDRVWSLIKERHWDPEVVGESWTKAREELRPQVVAAKDRNAARLVIKQLIDRLEQSHFAVIPATAYKAMDEGKLHAKGHTGLVIRERDGKLIVAQIEPDSATAASEIRPGWVLTGVGKRDADDLLKVAEEATKTGPMSRATLVGLLCKRALGGDVGQAVQLKLLDLNGKEHDVELKLTKTPGTTVRAGNMPTIHVVVDSRELPGNVGYFGFSAFFDPTNLVREFDKRLKKSSGGLIIDLRGNVGGLMILPTALGSRLTGKPAKLGVVKMKNANFKMALNPWRKPYDKPVAVLIDECSISCAEILSGGLKDLKLARVFGTTTAGLALPSAFEKLPNGDGVQYAFADYTSESGKTLEGNGVTPDEEIALTTEAFKQQSDPVLARALEWLNSEISKSK